MIFKRKIYETLLNWKKENGKKALLIEGARRIGKSTIVEEFGKNEYRSYLKIDFSAMTNTVRSYFEEVYPDLDTFFLYISTAYGVQLYKRESLVIFDEVQFFPKARQAIKHLVADGRYDYIETGSLISIRENVKDILIPSEERHVRMYPMDFEEFCTALGNESIIKYIHSCFEKREPLERGLHNMAMRLFSQYMLVGGMPQSVNAFIESGRMFAASDSEKREILSLFRDDIKKIESFYRAKVVSIFDQIPGLLSKHEKRIIFDQIEKGSRSQQYDDPLFWLADSMIVNECFRTNDPNVDLSLNENRVFVKCYLGDTGLLVSQAFSENEILEEDVYNQILNGKLSINNGMLYENVIAQMLTASGHKLFFYTHYNEEKKRNDIEIDFLVSNNSKLKYKIFPIEVKSGTNYSITSLLRFRDKFKARIGECYVIHPRNLLVKDDIVYLPPYMAQYL